MFVCPRCSTVSHSAEDERHGYCAACHWWTGDPQLGSAEAIRVAEATGVISAVPKD